MRRKFEKLKSSDLRVGRKEQLPLTLRRAHKQVAVAEDWHPTTDGLVTVFFTAYRDGWFQVSVWGGDDTGMDIRLQDGERAQYIFDHITHLVTMAQLRDLGLRGV